MMKTLQEYREAGSNLFHKLHLATFPIAIKYIKEKSEIPGGTLQPSTFGKKMSLCQAFTQTRRSGTTIAMTGADNFCVPATAFHQWEKFSREDVIESQLRQGWHSGREAEEKRINGFFNIINQNKNSADYMGFISSPLPETKIIPDSVLVYGDGEQLTHIIHALSYEYKHCPASQFEGYGESCVKGGLVPFLTGIPQVVIPGAGDRTFAGIASHELAIGMPGELLFYVMDNLFKSGGFMNMGYPFKSMIPMHLDENITPGFKFLRDKIKG
jgi:uncharacterized protein (DUF169 family)